MSEIDHVGRVYASYTGDLWHIDRYDADILISPDGAREPTLLTPDERSHLVEAILHIRTRDQIGGRATDPPPIVIADSATEWTITGDGDRMLVSRGGTWEPSEFTRTERDELLRVLTRARARDLLEAQAHVA